jgi:ComF family protein
MPPRYLWRRPYPSRGQPLHLLQRWQSLAAATRRLLPLDGLAISLHSLGTALFPPHCGACNQPMPQRRPHRLCRLCFNTLTPYTADPCCEICATGLPPEVAATSRLCPSCRAQPPPFAVLRAPYVFGGALRELLHAAKFSGREDLATALGHLLAADNPAQTLAKHATCVVPMPLGRRRLRQRGYNQSVALAKVLGRSWQLPVVHALLRHQDTEAQSGLPAAARRSNVDGVFYAPQGLADAAVLVDDVVTSGATVTSAAQALRSAGVPQVFVLAVARAAF